MSYKSPVELFYGNTSCDLLNAEEDALVYEVNRQLLVNIDKEELLKALKYDREQYDAGYKDGLAEAKNIKAKYDALVGFLVEYEILKDCVCDVVTDEVIDDESWCEINCKFDCPKRICIDKFAEILARDEVV